MGITGKPQALCRNQNKHKFQLIIITVLLEFRRLCSALLFIIAISILRSIPFVFCYSANIFGSFFICRHNISIKWILIFHIGFRLLLFLIYFVVSAYMKGDCFLQLFASIEALTSFLPGQSILRREKNPKCVNFDNKIDYWRCEGNAFHCNKMSRESTTNSEFILYILAIVRMICGPKLQSSNSWNTIFLLKWSPAHMTICHRANLNGVEWFNEVNSESGLYHNWLNMNGTTWIKRLFVVSSYLKVLLMYYVCIILRSSAVFFLHAFCLTFCRLYFVFHWQFIID